MKGYESSYDADGNIRARFWSGRSVQPWDYFMELDDKCRRKFPKAVLVRVQRKVYIGNGSRVWWEMYWLKEGKYP